MNEAMITIVAVAMGGMGAAAIAAPERMLQFVGAQVLGRDGRNEVRAVYGGFGLMTAAVLFFFAIRASEYRAGLLLFGACALFSMAAGRVVSMAADRGISPRMAAILAGEIVGGALLLLAM